MNTVTTGRQAVEAGTAAPVGRSTASRILLGLGLVLIAFNLRLVFSSVSVLLPEIIDGTGISDVGASVLTTLPVVCLGLFAPLAARLAGSVGMERTFFGLIVLLAAGTALRGLGTWPLFAGQALAGACIAVANVLLPSLVKRDFPDRTALMMGLYTMALVAGAAAAAGATVPLEDALGGSWPAALAAWAVPGAVVAVIWLPQVLGPSGRVRPARFRVEGLWRDPLAWQVTLFMGLQSAYAYCVFGWLAPILRVRGLDAMTAGAVVSVSVLVQVAACLVVPSIAVRCRDQRGVNVVLSLLAGGALIAFLFAPLSWVWVLAVIQGIGQGGLIAAAVTLIVLRAPDSRVAAHLSGMVQCVGYLLASAGPLLVGIIRSVTEGFAATAALFVVIGVGVVLFGLGAGRPLHVGARAVPA